MKHIGIYARFMPNKKYRYLAYTLLTTTIYCGLLLYKFVHTLCICTYLDRGYFTKMLTGNRVVITGMGVLAPNGIGKDEFWRTLLAGESGIGPITLFDDSDRSVIYCTPICYM